LDNLTVFSADICRYFGKHPDKPIQAKLVNLMAQVAGYFQAALKEGHIWKNENYPYLKIRERAIRCLTNIFITLKEEFVLSPDEMSHLLHSLATSVSSWQQVDTNFFSACNYFI